VVLAFPPTTSNLAATGLSLTRAEKAVFGSVGVHNYFTTAAALRMPYGVSYVAAPSGGAGTPPPADGEPVAMLRLHQDSSVVAAWSWGPDGADMSEAYARDLARTTLSKINKDPRDANATAVALADADVRAFRKWDYFPHFGSAPLREGAYARLNALQGKSKTYFASGLAGFENVEWAIRGGKDVVESYF
jgi:hypothetical protein